MRRTPSGGIMHVVADLSEKDAGWLDEEEEVVSVAAEKNKALVRRFFEAHAKADLHTLRELLAPDFIDHRPLPGYEDPDRESYIQFVAQRSAALSDIRFIAEEQMAA